MQKYKMHLPISPYFVLDDDGEIKITLNNDRFPSKELIQKCITALEELLNTPQSEIDEYHDFLDDVRLTLSQKDGTGSDHKKPEYGYIYVYKQGEFYKIGKSKNPKTRLRKYITENPHPIEVVFQCFVRDYSSVESMLHEMFAHKNHRNEWFRLSEIDLKEIESLVKPHL